MWFYSVVFFAIVILLSLGYFFKFQKISYWICCFLMILMAGFRSSECCMDYPIYVDYYNNISSIPFTFLEPTFFIIAWLSKVLSGSVAGVFVIYSILGVSLKATAFIKLTRFYSITLILYFGSFFLLHEMTQIRVGVAAAFLMLSIPAIVDRKPWQFLTYIILGCLFHYSLITFAFVYFLKPDRLNRYIYLGMVFFAFIAFNLGLNLASIFEIIRLGFISEKINAYKNMLADGLHGEIMLLNPLLLLRILVLSILMYKFEFLQQRNKNAIILIKIYAFSIFFFIALADLPVLAGRLSQLFGIVEIILVPFVIYLLKPRYLAVIVAALFGMLIFYKQLFYSDLVNAYFK
jgi:hypothetical protein